MGVVNVLSLYQNNNESILSKSLLVATGKRYAGAYEAGEPRASTRLRNFVPVSADSHAGGERITSKNISAYRPARVEISPSEKNCRFATGFSFV